MDDLIKAWLKSHVKKISMIFLLGVGLVYLLFMMVLFPGNNGSHSGGEAEISGLTICAGADPVSGEPMSPDVVDGIDNKAVYVCGLLDVTKSTRLTSYWYYQNVERNIYFKDSYEQEKGYIYINVPEEYLQQPGKYRVDIYHYRNKIGTVKFRVEADRVTVQ